MQLICTWCVIIYLYDIIPYSGWFKKTKKEVNKNKKKGSNFDGFAADFLHKQPRAES
jgi:hypothetical protein